MSTVALAAIGSRFTIYGGSVLFSFGFLGNVITIYLFHSTWHTSIIFILTVLSIANNVSLVVGLLNRILVAAIGIDPSLISPVWCKLRVYIGQSAVLFCQSCACLASINCFLSSSRHAQLRQFVSLSISRRCIAIAALFWLLHGLFNPVLTELRFVSGSSSVCALTSVIASNYTGLFLRPFLVGVFPISILSTFGILTYRNLNRMRHKRQFHQQILSKMLFCQMIAYVLGTIPYASFYAYQSITNLLRTKSSIEQAQENNVLNFINIIFYMPQASPFYVYYLSSILFRKQFKDHFTCYRYHRVRPWTTQVQ